MLSIENYSQTNSTFAKKGGKKGKIQIGNGLFVKCILEIANRVVFCKKEDRISEISSKQNVTGLQSLMQAYCSLNMATKNKKEEQDNKWSSKSSALGQFSVWHDPFI